LRSVPGLRDFATIRGPFIRAMTTVQGVPHVVSRGGLYKIAESGAVTYLAAVTEDADTSIAGHRAAVTISAGGAYYVYASGAITQPGSGRISSVGSVAFQSQYTLMAQRAGRELEWTVAGTPGTRNALYFATAEARDDNIVRIMASGQYVYVFKECSTEVWQPFGSTTNAFKVVPGAVIQTGLKDFNLVCETPAGLFLVGSDGVAYMTQGAGLMAVSTPACNQALKTSTPTHCFYYEDRGHPFCCIRFNDRPAWCFDASMSVWHERSSGADHKPWDVTHAVFAYGQWLLASRLGRIYNLGPEPHDFGKTLRRTVVSRALYSEGNRFTVHCLEFMGNFGVSGVMETGPNYMLDELGFPMKDEEGKPMMMESSTPGDPIQRPTRMWIRASPDGGHTFGKIRVKDIGKGGQWTATCRFRNLGEFRQFAVEANITDPVDILLLSEANVS
jgi:hypothetical protein